MFIEPNSGNPSSGGKRAGWIEVICGSMFSGKTEELIRRLNRAILARQQVEIFKPVLDKRYHSDKVVSHDQNEIRSTAVDFANDILLLSGNSTVVGIDEAQFFDWDILNVCNSLANSGRRVIVAGLDMDYDGKPFGPMPGLMAIGEYLTKLHAICIRCGGIASYSYRLSHRTEQVLVGERQDYEARCRNCFEQGQNQN